MNASASSPHTRPELGYQGEALASWSFEDSYFAVLV
jgi:hypothetical protein